MRNSTTYLLGVVILVTVVLLGSCKASRQSSATYVAKSDSVSYVETVRVDTLIVPEDRSSATFYPDSIPVRYVGVVAYRDTGRSTVVVYRHADGSYTASARCDSIYRLLIAKDTEARSAEERIVYKNKEKIVFATPSWFKWLIAAAVAVFLFQIISFAKKLIP